MRVLRAGLRLTTVAMLMVAGLVGIGASPAFASPPTIIGWASNFDVSNGTDRPCHGFEIELEDITDTDIRYTYTNWHYGAPTRTNATFPSGHSGVKVRYAASYAGAWSQTSNIGAVEHFGISLGKSAGVQRYTWLCEDSLNPGTLVPYGGSTEGNYYPMPPPPTPTATVVPTPDGEVVRQEMENAEPPEPGQQHPDAVWVHRFAGSSATDVTLDDLMSTDPMVNQTIQNSILDGQFELVDGGNSLLDDDPISATDEASILIVDTYEYTGPYDDSHTPACDGLGGANDCNNFIGTTRLARQMFSADLATATTTRVPVDVEVRTGPNVSTLGGSVASNAVPSADPDTGIDCGTQCFAVVDSGSSVTLTATPNAGYHLQSWGGACSGSASTCTVTAAGTTHVTATFQPDDPTVFVSDVSVVEGAGGTSKLAKFTVSLSSAQPTATVVAYSTSDATATAGIDYLAKSGTVKVAAGKTSASVAVKVLGDADVEGEETLSLDVGSVTPGTVAIGNPSATGSVLDDDTAAAPVLSMGDAKLYEGNAGTQLAVFPLTLSSPSAAPVPVVFHTSDGTASAGADYVAKSGTVNIPAGVTASKITVTVKGETVAEGDETFRVTIDDTGASGVPVELDKALGTIVDDDTLGLSGVGLGASSVSEGHSGKATATVTVTLSAPSATSTVVQYHTIDLSATAGSDYSGKTGKLTILAGKTTGTITITVNGDTSTEAVERMMLVVDNAGSTPVHSGSALVRVLDDDAV